MKASFNFGRKAFLTLMATVAFLAAGLSAYAQSTIRGTVADANGEPVVGASVIVPGTTTGVITDQDGSFVIRVTAGTPLEISCIGYATQTLPAANGMAVTLAEDTTFLDEVVVVGYGVQKKSDVTGAVARVGADELNIKPVNNAFEALQGKVAGVDITSSERPGTIGSIYIRGQRSISAETGPLYVVDGVPLQSGGIDSINPRDIESIDILKDASSCAIYGSRGANGVVLVTTKRGKSGQMALNYTGTVTLEKLVDKSPAMDADEYITWRRWAYYNNAPDIYTPGDQPNYDQDQSFFAGDPYALANVNKGWVNGKWDGSKVENTDWASMVTRTGVTQEHTLSASGGTDKVQAFASFGYLDNKGTQMGQEFQRYNFTLAVDIQAKPWAKIGGSINGSWAVQDYGFSRTGQVGTSSGPNDIYSASKALLRYTVPYDDKGEIINMPGGSVVNQYTVVDEWKKSTNNRQTFRALGSFYALVDFGKIWEPLAGLTYRFSYGPDFRHNRTGIFLSSQSANRVGGKNYASLSTNRALAWTLDNQINYNRTFGKHTVGLTLLQTASKYNAESTSESGQNIPNEHFLWYNLGSIDITDASTYGASMGSGLTETQLVSYMARLNYNYADKYLLTVSGRYDGSSVLAEGHKWAFFPSFALGWRLDQEEFLKDARAIDLLKLRFGIGVTGNAGVGAYGTLGNIQSFFVPFGSEAVLAYATNEPYYTGSQVAMANKALGWEKTTQYNYGLDYRFFGGRVNGSFDFYHSDTNDLLLDMTIPTLTGFPKTKANVGKTHNVGVDFSLTVVPVSTRDFNWTSSLNFGWSKDKIVELQNGKQDNVANAWFIGQPIQVFYGYENDGLWQKEDAAEMAKFNEKGSKFTEGSVKPVDQNGDYVIDDEDRVILGRKRPSLTGGWTNTFTWKGLELNVELYGRMGYMISTGGEGQLGMYAQRKIDYWRPDNTDAEWQKPVYSTAGGDTYSGLLGFKNASFLKVRNISLGYVFPRKACEALGISSLKVYAQGKNLGNLYTTVDFIDLDLGTTYYNRGVIFGVQIGF